MTPPTTGTVAAVSQAGRRNDDLPQPSSRAGLGHQLRFVMRLDRVRATVWFVALIAVVMASAQSTIGLYHTAAQRRSYAQIATADDALKAITGPGHGLAARTPDQGAVVMNEVEMYAYIAIALMSVFMVIRHTRAEEDSDRGELVRSAPVGRLAPLVAACTWVGSLNLAIGAALTLGMIAIGLPAAGSVAFGAGGIGIGLVFVGVSAVAAQIATNARSAHAMAGVVLGASFVLRAVGDIGGGALSWASPLGWAQASRAYADERWWVLVLPMLVATILVASAIALSARRDLGAGFLPQRPGPARADPSLSSPVALARRLQRNSVIGWVAAMAFTGFFLGLVADQADQLAENEALAKVLSQSGQGSITESFLATLMLLMGIIASGFVVASVLRLRTEERALRAGPILATPVSRRRWLFSHLTVAATGSVLIMLATGVGIGIGYTVGVGDPGEVLPLLVAGLAMVAPLWVLGAVTAALVGLWPDWAAAAWAGVAMAAVTGLLAETLNLPRWARDLSPFQHVPLLPAADFEVLPLALLLGVTATLLTVAVTAIDHRDIS